MCSIDRGYAQCRGVPPLRRYVFDVLRRTVVVGPHHCGKARKELLSFNKAEETRKRHKLMEFIKWVRGLIERRLTSDQEIRGSSPRGLIQPFFPSSPSCSRDSSCPIRPPSDYLFPFFAPFVGSAFVLPVCWFLFSYLFFFDDQKHVGVVDTLCHLMKHVLLQFGQTN